VRLRILSEDLVEDFIRVLPECEFHVILYRGSDNFFNDMIGWEELPGISEIINPPPKEKSDDPFAEVSDDYGGSKPVYADVSAQLRGSHPFMRWDERFHQHTGAKDDWYEVVRFGMNNLRVTAITHSQFLGRADDPARAVNAIANKIGAGEW